MLRKRNHFPVEENFEDAEFPLAQVLIVNKVRGRNDYVFLEKELASSYSPNNLYCYSVDHKSDKQFHMRMKRFSECVPNVVVSTPEWILDLNGHNLTRALLDCLRLLTVPEKRWEYVALLRIRRQNKTADVDERIKNNDVAIKTNWEMHFEIRFKNIFKKCWMEFANPCPNQTVLIMLTMSRRHGFENRKGIRQTWMNDSVNLWCNFHEKKRTGEAVDVQKKLEEEQAEHGDLVFLHGFVDIYAHIHLKWYGALKWQQSFCANAKWVMKVDDDALVHLRRWRIGRRKHFVQWLSKIRWYISKDVYPKDMYTDFMQGTVYLTTPATINAILLYTRQTDGFYLDDVLYTGILAELANVTLSEQQKHFMWFFNFDEKNGQCEDGVPTPFLIWGAKKLNVFEHQYGRMKSIECKKN
uniref:Hexosyltransferase n=1 Tax=Globodera rostochiensis TaxID=31243 RepID=A0A914H2I3_GLORO